MSTFMLGLGVLSGMILNLINIRNDAERLAWSDPVVLSTWLLFCWLLGVVLLSAVYRPARQGHKVAYLTLASFVLFAMMLAIGLLMDSRHWGRGAKGAARGARESLQRQVADRAFVHYPLSTIHYPPRSSGPWSLAPGLPPGGRPC
jgi:hypothetical protein